MEALLGTPDDSDEKETWTQMIDTADATMVKSAEKRHVDSSPFVILALTRRGQPVGIFAAKERASLSKNTGESVCHARGASCTRFVCPDIIGRSGIKVQPSGEPIPYGCGPIFSRMRYSLYGPCS